MLKYVSKFAMDILPSVAATIIGAYIVNHYIIAKPAADAPAAAAVSSADPKKVTAKADSKPPETSSDLANIPEAGVRAKGISEKAHLREIGRREAVGEIRGREARRQAGGDRKHPRRHAPASAGAARKDGRQDGSGAGRRAGGRHPGVAAPNAAPPVEAAIAPDDHRDANELARAAIERLRGTNEGPPRTQEAARTPDTPRLVSTTRARVCCGAVRPLPPPIMVSTPGNDRFDSAPGSSPNPPYAAAAPIDDPRRPTPPADIPAAPPLDLRAEAAEPPPRRPHQLLPKTCCRRRNRCFTRYCRSNSLPR